MIRHQMTFYSGYLFALPSGEMPLQALGVQGPINLPPILGYEDYVILTPLARVTYTLYLILDDSFA